jgi:hypothetical protein
LDSIRREPSYPCFGDFAAALFARPSADVVPFWKQRTPLLEKAEKVLALLAAHVSSMKTANGCMK